MTLGALEASGCALLESSGRALLDPSGCGAVEAIDPVEAVETVDASGCFVGSNTSDPLDASTIDAELGPSCDVQHGNVANVPRANVKRRRNGTAAS